MSEQETLGRLMEKYINGVKFNKDRISVSIPKRILKPDQLSTSYSSK